MPNANSDDPTWRKRIRAAAAKAKASWPDDPAKSRERVARVLASPKKATNKVTKAAPAEVTRAGVTLYVGDIHAPFHHEDTLAFLEAVKDEFLPANIVLLGDEIDAHAVSDWDHDPDGYSAGHELHEALVFMNDLYKVFPKAMVCESNHTFRVAKRAYRIGIPSQWLRHVRDVLEAPDTWHWADHWVVDGVRSEHGESFGGQSGAYRTALFNQQSTIIGHIHSHAGINWVNGPSSTLFSMNVGCLVNDTTYAFRYAKHTKQRPWVGVGLVEDGVPRLLPMKLDGRKRWTGKL